MKSAQSISLIDDKYFAFDGANVINEADQVELGRVSSTPMLTVNMNLFNLYEDLSISQITFTGLLMTYSTDADMWFIALSDGSPASILNTLDDRAKYIGQISDGGGNVDGSSNPVVMRSFKMTEFVVENDRFEAAMLRYPFEISSGYMVWYNPGQIGTVGEEVMRAPVYEGGVGTTPARDAAHVTHRGDLEMLNLPS